MKLVSVETPEKSVCKMTFSATAEELEAASNAVYERTRANYTIKGFEKGEADRAQIEADRGEHTFWYDAINDLMDKDVPALYDAALAEHGFHPVDEPSYDLVSVKKDEGFVATATVALQPELNLTQTTGFVVECVTPAVTDKEIDAVLERRRNAAAELVPHKGPAVKGNVVHMDFEGLLDGVAFQGGTAQNQSVQLGSGRMIPGFEDGILGHKAGDEGPGRQGCGVQDQAARRVRAPAAFHEQRLCQESGRRGHHGRVPREGAQAAVRRPSRRCTEPRQGSGAGQAGRRR